MLYIQHGGKIRLTRGDTAMLKVSITNDITGNEYTVAEDDTMVLTIKKDISDTDVTVQKTLVGESTFHIEPNDTRSLEFGKYIYDVQLNKANGEVYTIIEPITFEILQEVTC